MCLIVRCEKQLPLNKPLVEHWLERNGDGWGMMWLQENTLQVHRSTVKTELWDKYLELKEFDPIIHLRWRTHGDTDLANCHPYYCGHGIFLMHNGVISDAGSHTKDKSDTWHFVEDWVKNFFSVVQNPHQVMRTSAFRQLFEKAIGSNNRIVLGDRGGFVYFNENMWHTIENEHTGVKGLLVSNMYAWDAMHYGEPVKEIVHTRSHYSSRHNYNAYGNHYNQATPVTRIDGTMRNSMGLIMTNVVGNIYVDDAEQAWVWQQGVFQRCPEIDKNIRKRIKKELKKNKGLIPIESPQTSFLLPAPEPKAIIVVNDPNTNDEYAEATITYNREEYSDVLVKQWQGETKAAIHTLVYAEPEDAATVLCKLMGK